MAPRPASRPAALRPRPRGLVPAAISLALVLTGTTAPAAGARQVGNPDPIGSLLRTDGPGDWTVAAVPPGPDGRFMAHSVHAPELGLFILYGGLTDRGLDNDVFWMRPADPGAGWQTLPAGAGGPPVRTHAATAWDPVGRRMLVFGGSGSTDQLWGSLVFGSNFLNDVWALEFDAAGTTASWKRLDTPAALGPSGRAASSAVYDPIGRRLVVYGGNDTVKGHAGAVGDTGELFTGSRSLKQGLNEVWAFDLDGTNGWTKLSGGVATNDPDLFHHQAIYDPVNRQMVVTGGMDGLDRTNNELHTNPKTYSYDLVTARWTQWSPAGRSPAMASAPYGYSPELGALVVGRGIIRRDAGLDPTGLYALDLGPGGEGATWRQLPSSGVPHRMLAGVTGTTVGSSLVVFGGNISWGSDGYNNETTLSAYDAATGRWREVIPGSAAMHATAEAVAVYDPVRHHAYIVGGRRRARTVWDLDVAAGRWSKLTAPGVVPDVAARPAAAFDSARGRLLVYAKGQVSSIEPGRPGARWTTIATVGDAPNLVDSDAVYDPIRDRLLLLGGKFRVPQYDYYFGGGQSADPNQRVFSLSLSSPKPAWRALDATGVAPRLMGGAAVHDARRDRILVYGGFTPGNGYSNGQLNDAVHELALSSGDGRWRTLSPAGTAPSARDDAVAVYDGANDRMIVWGGDVTDRKVYELGLDGSEAWSTLSTTSDPIAREGAAGFYDPAGKRLVVFGGFGQRGDEATVGSRDTLALALGGDGVVPPAAFAPENHVPPEPGPVVGGRWLPLGPPAARTVAVALAADHAQSGRIFAGTVNSNKVENDAAGLLVSDDRGDTWRQAEGAVGGAAVLRIAPAPTDPNRVYAATRAERTGMGIVASDDGGLTWRDASEGLVSGAFYALAVHPTNPDVAWAASDVGGLSMTVDGGRTWSDAGFAGRWVYGITAVPLPTGVRLLTAVREIGAAVHGAGQVFVSDDLGTTWDLLFNDDDYVTYGFAYDPSDPSRVLLSAGNGIWRSQDGGLTWTHLDDRAIQAASLAFDPSSGGRIVYGAGVAMPVNFGGVAGGPVSPAQTPGLFRSTDGGTSWTSVDGAPEEDFGGVAVTADGDEVFGAGIDSGIFRSRDSGSSFDPAVEGFVQGVAASIAVDAGDPQHLVAAGQHDGVHISDDGGASWRTVDIVSQYGTEPVWYATGSPVKPGRYLAANYSSVFKSEDGGESWTKVELPDYEAPASYYGQPGSIAFDPKDKDSWYVTTANTRSFLVTRDNGATFTSTEVGAWGALFHAIAVDPTNTQKILIGDTNGGGVFRSSDGGASFVPSSEGLEDTNVTALAFDPGDTRRVWAGTLHEGIFRSEDGGATWRPATRGLGFHYVKSLAFSGGRLFAAVYGRGVYESDDGETWTPVRTGLAGAMVLHVLAHGDQVYSASSGGGVARLGP